MAKKTYGVTTKGNGDAFVSEERHTSLSCGGGEPGQGYPCVMIAIGVDCYNFETTGEVAKTHTAGRNDKNHIPVVVLENHPADSRVKIDNSGTIQTLTSRCGTGGGNTPMVMFSKVRRAKDKDDFETWKESNVTNTKNTFDMGDVRATDVVVCLEGNGSRPTHQGDGYRESDTMYTLNTIERHAVAYSIGFMRQLGGVETKEDISPTLQAANGESGNNKPCVVYPNVTGVLTAKGYSGQDAYNDMFVVEEAYCIGNGQVHDAVQTEKELCKTLNCMDDPMKIMIRK